MNKFFDLFDDSEEYPSNERLLNGVPMNMLFEYVSDTYLNGFINYVDIKKVLLIQRYWSEKEYGPWDEFVKKAIEKGSDFHTDYRIIEDDVLFLAESESSWWFFWNDRDCSDCFIGRIDKTKISYDDLEKALIEFIEEHLEDPSDITGVYAELPLPSGWKRL